MAYFYEHKTWLPYMNGKDCSHGFCTFDCSEWCYRIYPPPPPFQFPQDNSNPSFSPLVIAIIGVLASAFLLVSYYTLISKYCGSMDFSQTQNHDDQNEELEENHHPSLREPWQAANTGLDEALIKTITVCKYKKGDGLVEVIDCSICLSEFEEDENIRLLPKCSHAFHLPCIDTWLKSHSNCPLCRANTSCFNTSSLQQSIPTVIEIPSRNEAISETQNENEVPSSVRRDHETSDIEEGVSMNYRTVVPKPALRVLSDLGNSHGRATIIEIKNESYNSLITRSISMDRSLHTQNSLSVADVLQMNQDDEDTDAQDQCSTEVGSSRQSVGETRRSRYKRRVLHRVLNPIAMKRSFSIGRFLLSTNGRDQQQATLPV